MSDHERFEVLLAQHVIDGIAPDERRELESLLGERTDGELIAWEQAAVLCDLAVRPTPQGAALTGELRQRLEWEGRQLLKARTLRENSAPPLAGPGSDALRRPASSAWWVAAAAALLAVLGWWPSDGERALTPAAQLAQLEATAPDLLRAEWAALDDPRLANIQGEVIWSDSLQRGFMRLNGVPRNDPANEQYQLWIVDRDRDVEPVDGGVFDVTESGEVLVPIDAKLLVQTPEVFAITLEQPGGVVVSEGPLLAAAAVQG